MPPPGVTSRPVNNPSTSRPSADRPASSAPREARSTPPPAARAPVTSNPTTDLGPQGNPLDVAKLFNDLNLEDIHEAARDAGRQEVADSAPHAQTAEDLQRERQTAQSQFNQEDAQVEQNRSFAKLTEAQYAFLERQRGLQQPQVQNGQVLDQPGEAHPQGEEHPTLFRQNAQGALTNRPQRQMLQARGEFQLPRGYQALLQSGAQANSQRPTLFIRTPQTQNPANPQGDAAQQAANQAQQPDSAETAQQPAHSAANAERAQASTQTGEANAEGESANAETDGNQAHAAGDARVTVATQMAVRNARGSQQGQGDGDDERGLGTLSERAYTEALADSSAVFGGGTVADSAGMQGSRILGAVSYGLAGHLRNQRPLNFQGGHSPSGDEALEQGMQACVVGAHQDTGAMRGSTALSVSINGEIFDPGNPAQRERLNALIAADPNIAGIIGQARVIARDTQLLRTGYSLPESRA